MQGQQHGYGMVNNQMPGNHNQYGQVAPQPQVIVNLQQPQYEMSPQHPASSSQNSRGHVHAPSGPQEWKNSLCGCFDDLGSCCLTCCCPCVQYGMNHEKVHKDGCCMQGLLFCLLSCCGLSCCIHSALRSNVRQKYNIPEGCSDCCTTCFCSGCAICQEARELKDRG